MTTTRFCAVPLGSLLVAAALLISNGALAQNAPPNQGYPDPNAQPQYQQPPQQYQQQPGYPPQQQPAQPPPPQDYQQQQPYPQQQYQQPGYPPQQQPYPQQPGYPPPGYPPPPPAYRPSGYPPPPSAYPPPPMAHHGLLLSGFIGVNAFVGSSGQGIDPGLRLGGLIGFYATPVFSINGELSIDFMNLNNNAGDITAVRAALSLSPLYHLATSGNFEIVLGPKLGVWDEEYDDSSGNKLLSYSGYLVGINAGGYMHVGNTLLGGLFSFENSVIDKGCQPDSFGIDQCGSISGADSRKVLAFNLSALF